MMKKKLNEKEKKNKEELYKLIDEKTKVISHPTTVTETVNIFVNGFPKGSFDIWRKQCKELYNDIYFVKMWSDHLKAQAYDVLINSAVQQVVEPPVVEEKENEDVPITFGTGEG